MDTSRGSIYCIPFCLRVVKMVLPLLVAGGLGIAGTLLGSWLGSSKKEASQETQQQVTAQQPAEVTIHPYSFTCGLP